MISAIAKEMHGKRANDLSRIVRSTKRPAPSQDQLPQQSHPSNDDEKKSGQFDSSIKKHLDWVTSECGKHGITAPDALSAIAQQMHGKTANALFGIIEEYQKNVDQSQTPANG